MPLANGELPQHGRGAAVCRPSMEACQAMTRRARAHAALSGQFVAPLARTHATAGETPTIAREHAYNEPPLCCWPRHRQRDARRAHAREEGQADDAATRPLAHHQADGLISLRVRDESVATSVAVVTRITVREFRELPRITVCTRYLYHRVHMRPPTLLPIRESQEPGRGSPIADGAAHTGVSSTLGGRTRRRASC